MPASVLLSPVLLQSLALSSGARLECGPWLQFKCHGVPMTGADVLWKAKPSCVTQHQLDRHMDHNAVLGEAASVRLAKD
ncbi:hypothetical protein AAY473_009469 [Plecturocebus cupreus]